MRTAQLAAEAKAKINRVTEKYLIFYKITVLFDVHKMKSICITLTNNYPLVSISRDKSRNKPERG